MTASRRWMKRVVRMSPFLFAAVVCALAVARFGSGPIWVVRALAMAMLPIPLLFFAAFLVPERAPPLGDVPPGEKAPSLALFGVGALLTLGVLGHVAQQTGFNLARSPSAPFWVSLLACADFLNGMRLRYLTLTALLTGIGLGLGIFLFVQLV